MGTKMTSEQSVALVRHIMEDGFNKQDMSVVQASFHESYMRHGIGVPSKASLAEHIEGLLAYHRAFTDAKFTIKQIVGDGETVAVHYVFSGVHTGDYSGAPATGKLITRPTAAFFTIVDGKVAEGTLFADAAALSEQLRGG